MKMQLLFLFSFAGFVQAMDNDKLPEQKLLECFAAAEIAAKAEIVQALPSILSPSQMEDFFKDPQSFNQNPQVFALRSTIHNKVAEKYEPLFINHSQGLSLSPERYANIIDASQRRLQDQSMVHAFIRLLQPYIDHQSNVLITAVPSEYFPGTNKNIILVPVNQPDTNLINKDTSFSGFKPGFLNSKNKKK